MQQRYKIPLKKFESSACMDELVLSTIAGRFPRNRKRNRFDNSRLAQRSPCLSANGSSGGVCPLPPGDEGVSTRPAFWYAVLGWGVPTPPWK